jgi:phage shock protein A
LADQRDKLRQLEAYQARLEKSLRSANTQVQDYRRELRMVQATASAQTASRQVAGSTHTIVTRTADMQSSLQRIKQTQQAMADQMDALAQVERAVNGRDLEERLRSVGCSQNADPAAAVLERIKAKANRSPAIGE